MKGQDPCDGNMLCYDSLLGDNTKCKTYLINWVFNTYIIRKKLRIFLSHSLTAVSLISADTQNGLTWGPKVHAENNAYENLYLAVQIVPEAVIHKWKWIFYIKEEC